MSTSPILHPDCTFVDGWGYISQHSNGSWARLQAPFFSRGLPLWHYSQFDPLTFLTHGAGQDKCFQVVDESLEGGAQFKALTQQLQRLDGVVAERVDAVLAARGRGENLGCRPRSIKFLWFSMALGRSLQQWLYIEIHCSNIFKACTEPEPHKGSDQEIHGGTWDHCDHWGMRDEEWNPQEDGATSEASHRNHTASARSEVNIVRSRITLQTQ